MSVPVLEARTLVAIRLPGPNLAHLVGAPTRPGLLREVMCRAADHPPVIVEHQRGPGTRDIYRRDDKAVSLSYRYEGTVLR